MQNCFREYPEIYGAELEPDEEDDVTADDVPAEAVSAAETTARPTESFAQSSSEQEREHALTKPSKLDPNGLVPESYRPDAEPKPEKTKRSEGADSLVPNAAYDGTPQSAARK
jgi:intermembrane space import and assembly protein 40